MVAVGSTRDLCPRGKDVGTAAAGVVATSLSVIVDVVAVGTTGSVSPQATTAIIDNSNSRSLAAGLVMSAPLAN